MELEKEFKIVDYTCYAELDDNHLFKKYSELKQILKELEICKKLFEEEINDRTQCKDFSTDIYSVEYKSSNLFDKEKARDYLYENFNEQDIKEFVKTDLDYKKVQQHMQDNFAKKKYTEYFCKQSKPTMNVRILK